jgi:hypothetical protein
VRSVPNETAFFFFFGCVIGFSLWLLGLVLGG